MRRVTLATMVAVVLSVAVVGCLTPLTSQQPLTPWNDPFSSSFAQTAWHHHAYVLVQLQPNGVTLAAIASGRSDDYLRAFADDVVAFGHPVILSFGHEMNGTWYSWGYGRTSPETFVAAWRHVVSVFRGAGAANVTWLWTVNSITGASSSLRPWWPGGSWVNWIGIDGYYYRATDSFGSVFGSTVADIRTFSRAPLLIAETAVGTTTDRESQVDALFAGADAAGLTGLIWFDATHRRPARIRRALPAGRARPARWALPAEGHGGNLIIGGAGVALAGLL